MIKIREISWELVLPMWGRLWEGRKDIPMTSAISYGGFIDMKLMEQWPTLIGAYIDDELVGVNSFVPTSPTQMRSRGLYVLPEYRRRNVATRLLQYTILECMRTQYTHLWTIPRRSALSTYERVGFLKTSEWTTDLMQFGTNCYASMYLRSLETLSEIVKKIRTGREDFSDTVLDAAKQEHDNMDHIRMLTTPLAIAEWEFS